MLQPSCTNTCASTAPYEVLKPCPVDSWGSAAVYAKIKTAIPWLRPGTELAIALGTGELLVDAMRLSVQQKPGAAADKQATSRQW